jgi:hypothetical protein
MKAHRWSFKFALLTITATTLGCGMPWPARDKADTALSLRAEAPAEETTAATGPTTTPATSNPTTTVAVAPPTTPARPSQPPADSQAFNKMAEDLADISATNPAAHRQLMQDLKQAKPDQWPLIVHQFRASLAYHQQLLAKASGPKPSTQIADRRIPEYSYPSTSQGGLEPKEFEPSDSEPEVDRYAQVHSSDRSPTLNAVDFDGHTRDRYAQPASNYVEEQVDQRRFEPDPYEEPATGNVVNMRFVGEERYVAVRSSPSSPMRISNPHVVADDPFQESDADSYEATEPSSYEETEPRTYSDPLREKSEIRIITPAKPSRKPTRQPLRVENSPPAQTIQAEAKAPAQPAETIQTNVESLPAENPVQKTSLEAPVREIEVNWPWKTLTEHAIERLKQKSADYPRTAEEVNELVELRLLQLIVGQTDEATSPIEGISATEQDYWSHQLAALATYLDAEAEPDVMRRASAASVQLDEAAQNLRDLGSLSVDNLTFCQEVIGFGAYETYPADRFAPGQQISLYAEIDHFDSKLHNATYHTSLASSYKILDESGKRIEGGEFPTVDDDCRSRRHDFHIQYGVMLPKRLTPGRYQLELVVRDRLSNKIARNIAPFEIASEADPARQVTRPSPLKSHGAVAPLR